VQRAVSVSQESGGKGVNVSRALVASGLESLAVLPGADNDPVLAGLRESGVPFVSLPIHEPLRTNVALTEPGGVTTKINEPGPLLDADQQESLMKLLVESSRGASWVVLAGSLPPGFPADFYATVARRLRSAADGTAPQIAVDSSGAPLAAAVSSDTPVQRRVVRRRVARQRGSQWFGKTGPPQTQRRRIGGAGCCSRFRLPGHR
jgi:1-phosphofructokinase